MTTGAQVREYVITIMIFRGPRDEVEFRWEITETPPKIFGQTFMMLPDVSRVLILDSNPESNELYPLLFDSALDLEKIEQ